MPTSAVCAAGTPGALAAILADAARGHFPPADGMVSIRWETSIEVDPAFRGRGLGTRLAIAARYLAPAGVPLWAQIAPANAASVRAFLTAGFRPVGAEALLSAQAGA